MELSKADPVRALPQTSNASFEVKTLISGGIPPKRSFSSGGNKTQIRKASDRNSEFGLSDYSNTRTENNGSNFIQGAIDAKRTTLS
jgi:hypothetical protein